MSNLLRILVLVGLCLRLPASAQPFTVSPGTNLQAVFSQVGPGQVIQLQTGTYRFSTGLVLQGVQNVTIIGVGGPVEIVVDSPGDDVLTISNSRGVVLQSISARHLQPDNNLGACQGAVIKVVNSAEVGIVKCELNGCGASGVHSVASQDVVVSSCFLHSNSFAGVWAEGGSILVHGCTIQGNARSVFTSGQTDLSMVGNTIRLNTLNNGTVVPSNFAQGVLRR